MSVIAGPCRWCRKGRREGPPLNEPESLGGSGGDPAAPAPVKVGGTPNDAAASGSGSLSGVVPVGPQPGGERWPGDPLDGLAGDEIADAEMEFLLASIAVWEEIDKHIDANGHYVAGVPESLGASEELRQRELAAWRRYRDLRAASKPVVPVGPQPGGEASRRTVEEIRTTGAAWVTESELEWLCDLAATGEEAIPPAEPSGGAADTNTGRNNG